MKHIQFVEDYFYKTPEHDSETIATVLSRPVSFIDEYMYSVELIAGAIHPNKNWIAWIDYYQKVISPNMVDCQYYLRAEMDGELKINWIIKTYNPYFGCRPGYMAWHNEQIVLIYSEKHEVYAATISVNGVDHFAEIGRVGAQLYVGNDVAIIQNYGAKSLNCFRLVTWEKLGPMSHEEGIEKGILQPVEPDSSG